MKSRRLSVMSDPFATGPRLFHLDAHGRCHTRRRGWTSALRRKMVLPHCVSSGSSVLDEAPSKTKGNAMGSVGPRLISVSSQLAQSYRQASPFVAGGRTATAYNPSALQTEVFTVGTDGHLRNLYPDGASDTGWSVVDLLFPRKLKLMNAGTRADGTIVVYVVDDENVLSSIQKGPGAAWESWVTPAVPTSVFDDPGLWDPDRWPVDPNGINLVIKSIDELKIWYEGPEQNPPVAFELRIGVLCSVTDKVTGG